MAIQKSVIEGTLFLICDFFQPPNFQFAPKNRKIFWALIVGSATLNGLPDRAKRPKYSTNKAFNKSGIYSKSPKVADAMIEADIGSETRPAYFEVFT
jgi:hypothetical protein